ncbi:MAG: 2-C-methyl-D-erythritol 2,4-cyclodiphosphate synthase [Methylocystaceae bacterium]
MRIGQGFDVHPLVAERKLILGGVEIAFDRGLLGHSDADVLVHAIMDSLLGAAAKGDIGQHFPPSDPQFAGANSLELLTKVRNLIREDGYRIVNVDATIIAEAPHLAPYIAAMREKLAPALDIPGGCISIKATTSEGLGFTGRGEGIAALAVALISKQGGMLTL